MGMMLARIAEGGIGSGSVIAPVRPSTPPPLAPPLPAGPTVEFALPAPALRPLITTYYRAATPGPVADQLHPEWGNIRFSLQGRWTLRRAGVPQQHPPRHALYGPTDSSASIATDGPSIVIGIGLTGLGWTQLVREPANLHANRVCEAGGPLGAVLDELHDALLTRPWAEVPGLFDERFDTLAASAPPADPQISLVQSALIDGDLRTAHDFAASLGMTERTLSRLCQRVFGFAPKRLLRRQRFLRTLADIGDRLDQPLATLLDGGYFDQSQFNREFKAYMGMTPLAYFHSPRQMMRRAASERLRTAGAMVQALHHIKAD